MMILLKLMHIHIRKMQIIGNTFMKKFLMNNFLFIILFIFISCEKGVTLNYTSDELLHFFENNCNTEIDLKKAEIYVTGKVGWISFPKDGRNLNQCTVFLETNNSDSKKRTGNYISCHMINRIEKSYFGKNIVIHGKFDSYTIINQEKYVVLKKCKMFLKE